MKLRFKAKLDDEGRVECLVVPTSASLANHFETAHEHNTLIEYMSIYEFGGMTRFSTSISVIAHLWNKWPTVEVEVPDTYDPLLIDSRWRVKMKTRIVPSSELDPRKGLRATDYIPEAAAHRIARMEETPPVATSSSVKRRSSPGKEPPGSEPRPTWGRR